MALVDQYMMERNAEILLARSAVPDFICRYALMREFEVLTEGHLKRPFFRPQRVLCLDARASPILKAEDKSGIVKARHLAIC